VARHQDQRVLAVPAEAGARGDGAIDDARGIDQKARFDRVADFLLEANV
jgi:hypothetical protein